MEGGVGYEATDRSLPDPSICPLETHIIEDKSRLRSDHAQDVVGRATSACLISELHVPRPVGSKDPVPDKLRRSRFTRDSWKTVQVESTSLLVVLLRWYQGEPTVVGKVFELHYKI